MLHVVLKGEMKLMMCKTKQQQKKKLPPSTIIHDMRIKMLNMTHKAAAFFFFPPPPFSTITYSEINYSLVTLGCSQCVS